MATSESVPEKVTFSWTIPEYIKRELGGDWYVIVWTIAGAGAVISLILENILFAVIVLVSTALLSFLHNREPQEITITINAKGVQIGDQFHAYNNLKDFAVRANFNNTENRLLIQSKHDFRPLISLPINPEIEIEDLRAHLAKHLEESEELEEPITHHLSDRLGV